MKFSRLWSLRLETSPETAESFAEALGEAPLALTILAPPRSRKAHIEALYGEKPDLSELTARLAVSAALHKLRVPKLHIREMPNLDWLGKVAGDFPPLHIGRWTIHGAQHRHKVPDRRNALQIDATNAFGTGEHLTTRGCLLMLDLVLKSGFRGRHMLDMGCGSGILALAWAKAQQGRAVGIDIDEASVRIAKDNASVNGLRSKIRVAQGRGYHHTLVRRNASYDLIMANIFARPLAEMAKDLRRNLRPGGMAILSGLLFSQINLVLAAHRMQKIYPVRVFRIGEWGVLALKKEIHHACFTGQ